ncbi:MAG: recombinase family protein [Acidobacteria bacterium]|nr:recombinase family protein [Acidobacteriota bacterium]
MNKVIELIRVSTEKQAGTDRAGIPAQREINRRTASIYSLQIVKTIEIVDVSGASVLLSPEMQELLREMKSPDIDGVLAKEFSRLMRPENFNDYALLQHFIDTRTILFLPDGPIDLSTKTGRLIGPIRAAMAGIERREILDRMLDAKESMRRAGKHPGGCNTLARGIGYTKKQGWHYTPEIEGVKLLFRLFLEGHQTYEQLAKTTGYARSSVPKLLKNPAYSGWMVYSEKRDSSPSGYVPRLGGRQGHRRKIARSLEETIRIKLPLQPIVSENDFAAVQAIIEQRRRTRAEVLANYPKQFIYNGFLLCADCGRPLYTHVGNTHGARAFYYYCGSKHPRYRKNHEGEGLPVCTNQHMRRDPLEAKISAILSKRIIDPQFLLPIVSDYLAHRDSYYRSGAIGDALGKRSEFLQKKRQRILETYIDGLMAKDERDAALQKVDVELNRITGMQPATEQPTIKAEDVIRAVSVLAEYPFFSRDDKRVLLKDLVPEISVYRGDIKGLILSVTADRDNSHRSRTVKLPSPVPRCR